MDGEFNGVNNNVMMDGHIKLSTRLVIIFSCNLKFKIFCNKLTLNIALECIAILLFFHYTP